MSYHKAWDPPKLLSKAQYHPPILHCGGCVTSIRCMGLLSSALALQVCWAWGYSQDGSLRPTDEMARVVPSLDNATPLRAWLGDWLKDAPVSPQHGLPVVCLHYEEDESDTYWRRLFVKAYLPREGRVAANG